MNNIQKRFMLFLLGCIPVRLLYAYLAKTYPKYLPYLGFASFIMGVSFLYLYLTNSRKTGAEVFGDKIWWNDFRPLHSLLHLSFAYLAIFNRSKNAWKVLVADAIIGLLLFLQYHSGQNNFRKLY